MKKGLALLVAAALIFSVFSGAVLAGKGSNNGKGSSNSSNISNSSKANGNNNNGNQNSQQLSKQDQIQEHIDDSFYQDSDLDLTEEEQAEFDQIKDDFFSERDVINEEIREKRQILNTLDEAADQDEIANLESEIAELEDELSQVKDEHIENVEDLVDE
jgi:Spy/CpxP family protein refolding chaperone